MITSRGLSLLKIAYKSSQSKVAATNLRSVRFHGRLTKYKEYMRHDLINSFLPCVYYNLGPVPTSCNHVYRDFPPRDKKWEFIAEVFGGIMWWWVLWHFWHDYGHIVGEFPYPDPSQWTDEELGIPPDDYPEPAIRTL